MRPPPLHFSTRITSPPLSDTPRPLPHPLPPLAHRNCTSARRRQEHHRAEAPDHPKPRRWYQKPRRRRPRRTPAFPISAAPQVALRPPCLAAARVSARRSCSRDSDDPGPSILLLIRRLASTYRFGFIIKSLTSGSRCQATRCAR